MALGQKPIPIGIANTYTLSEADGFPGYNYVTRAQFSNTGKIYIKDFFGNFHITGNNFLKHVLGLKNVQNNCQLKLQPDNQILFCMDEGGNVSIIKNDSLQKIVAFPSTGSMGFSNESQTFNYQIRPNGNYIEIYKFFSDKWVLLNKATWDTANKIIVATPGFINKQNIYIRTSVTQNKETIFILDTITNQFKLVNTIPKINNLFYNTLYKNSWQINDSLIQSYKEFYSVRTGKVITGNIFNNKNLDFVFLNRSEENTFIYNYQNGFYEFVKLDSTHILPAAFIFETSNILNHIQKNPYYPYYLALTNNKPMRVFPYIKKYPSIYNKKNSANIFALNQDDSGRIWAGSYDNYISIITPSNFEKGIGSKIIELAKQPYPFMNASLNFNHKLYFVGETLIGGFLQYDKNGGMHKLTPQTPVSFYLYYAPRSKSIWFPSAEGPNNPIYTCSVNDFEKPFIHWQKLDTTVGIKTYGFSTLTEDSLQRIWIGHPKKGFAVYNQKTKKAITYDLHKNETPIGFISCLTDNKGTVFMGSDDKGLWYYNDYTKSPTPQNIHNIYHPLLNNSVRITSMTIYNHWLVLGCYNKMLLLNLDSFYLKHKAIVRYLNPQEASFTSFTEQNTMLVSKTDSTLWFSTSDMLYQWDLKTWLQLPTYKTSLTALIQKDSNRIELNTNKSIHIKAGENSFDLAFEYLSPDCLPRYTRTSLVKQGDSVIFSEPNLQSKFSYRNLASDTYKFYIEVFEQDGSTSQYIYQFTINKYIWQQWWFWVLASFLFLTPLILWLNGLRKEAIQQKIISQLNIVTLSSQFRPHFILNALNTIGADLINKPDAETVLSRLGESINLIFNQAQQKRITHTLKNEWALIENLIDIHRIMYLPELQVEMPSTEWLEQNFNMMIPVGIIEIMVENAILHGLRNKKRPPYIIQLGANDDDINTYFTITDNGIGRTNSMKLSSYKKHGTGTKNLSEIIDILNKFNKNKIEIKYADNNLISEEGCGTIITIIIPKNYFYEY